MNNTNVREHMEVVASCGKTVGVVDAVQGDAIKLTKNGPCANGKHHVIPAAWVQSVDDKVHLSRNSEETMKGWKEDAAKAGV